MHQGDGFLISLIVGGEIAFWVFLAAGLLTRYALRMPRAGLALLACTALVDLVLLVSASADLLRGGTATQTHGLAAAYLGFSVGFGHRLIRWADGWFAHWFRDAERPRKPEGRARVAHEWRDWGRALVSWAVAWGIMLTLIVLVRDAERTAALWSMMQRLSLIVGIWFVAGPLWTSFTPPKVSRSPEDRALRHSGPR